MAKHLIKIDNPQHCALSVAHAGLDNQYCESGEVVAIDWQPSSGWGLQEAHYTDSDGNVVSIDLSLREFTMPNKAIVVSGTAKRFLLQQWTTNNPISRDNVMIMDANGSPSASDKVSIAGSGEIYTQGSVYAEGTINSEGDISAEGEIHVSGEFGIIFHTQDGDYSLTIDHGNARVDPYTP